jgi:DNA-binding response OmpR family regulator
MARILVIDDDVMLQRMLKQFLYLLGHDVRQAFDGKEGVRLCEESPPDLVITDILMPNQDGLQTIRELRRTCPEVKIVAMSGGSQLWPELDGLPFASRFGAQQVLYKPFGRGQLEHAVNEAIGA